MPALARATRTVRTRPKRAVPRPFMKWVGGKTQLLEQLVSRIPEDIGTYYEPFIGGGALFFALKPSKAVLGDYNSELIGTYKAVRDCLPELVEILEGHYYEKNYFYSVRSLDPKTLSPTQAAARTIYLNRTGFNGLYRVNSKGQFNVPFGRYSNPLICDHHNLEACSSLLHQADLRQGSYEQVLASAQNGDFAYLDPPYVPLSKTSNFTGYIPGGFGTEDQEKLAQLLVDLDSRGVRFMLSNAGSEASRALYKDLPIDGLRIETVQARRSVNSRTSGRGKVDEILVLNY
jgi:DNA adenine methylase